MNVYVIWTNVAYTKEYFEYLIVSVLYLIKSVWNTEWACITCGMSECVSCISINCILIWKKNLWQKDLKWRSEMNGAVKSTGRDRSLMWEVKQEWNLEGNSRTIGHCIIKAFHYLCHFDGVVCAFKIFLEANFRKEVEKKKTLKFRV